MKEEDEEMVNREIDPENEEMKAVDLQGFASKMQRSEAEQKQKAALTKMSIECIMYAKKNLVPFTEKFPDDIKHLFGLLTFI